MKTNLVLLLFLFPMLSWSQNKSSIDFIGGLEYSNRTLNVDDFNPGPGFDVLGSGKLNFRLGFNYNHRLAGKIHLKTGLRLASVGYRNQRLEDLRWGSEFNSNGEWEPDPTLPRELQLSVDYWFLEIPIVGRFEFNNKKFSPFIELGCSPHIYLTTRLTEKTNLATDTQFRNTAPIAQLNTFNLAASISMGFNYRFSPQWQLFSQPIFRYHLLNTSKRDGINEHLYNVGLEFGIRRKLG
ncbi:MAG: hypothetical protein AAGD05_05030 [Bacteroidota bacterium]